MPRKKKFPWDKVLGGVAIAGLVYAAFGAGSKKDSVLIPNWIEDEIDKIVDGLNQRFPGGWVDFGIDLLVQALAGTLSPNGQLLVAIISEVERWAAAQQRTVSVSGVGPRAVVSGKAKKQRAIELYKQRYGAAGA